MVLLVLVFITIIIIINILILFEYLTLCLWCIRYPFITLVQPPVYGYVLLIVIKVRYYY